MNLDTNIALGVRPPPIDFNAMNQGNVLAQLAQLKNADNQNALAQYQLSSAKRTDDSQTALMAAAQTPGFKIDFATAIKYGAPGMAAYKAHEDASTQALTRTKSQGEIDTSAYALQKKKLDAAIQTITNLNTAEEAAASINDSLGKKNIDQSRADQLLNDLKSKPFAQFKAEQLKGLLTAYEQVQNTTSIANNAANNATSASNNANTVAQAAASALMTDTRSREQFKQTQGLAERKFAYEKANPGMQYQEGPDGVGYGYNSKTNQMTPVMNAGGTNAIAPAGGANTNALAAPAPAQAVPPVAKPPAAAGAAGPMGITLPANAAAPAGVNAPGTPFVGKGEKMTEVQSNAAMFGGAMAQAQNVISELEKKGVVKPNVFAETVKGLAKLSPAFFGTGENAAMTAESAIRQITDSLGGITNDQARLAQAQLSFAVAYLRKTSGAAFGPSEILNTVQEFFPLIGEEAPVMNQKSKSRERAIEGMKISTNSEGKKYISSFQNQAPASNAVTNPSFPGFSIPGTPR